MSGGWHSGGLAGYTLDFKSGGSHNPAASTTYYIGNLHTSPPATSGGVRRVYVPASGVIRAAVVAIVSGGGGGSAETTNLSVRVNDTTNSQVIANVDWDVSQQYFSGTGLAIPIAVGDFLEITFTTPAWVSAPTSVIYMLMLYVSTP